MNDLGLKDFKSLLEKTTTLSQVKVIVECLDECWSIDDSIMEPDDWPVLSMIVRKEKKRIEGSPK